MVAFIAKVLSFFMPTTRLRKNARRKLVIAFWTHYARSQVKIHGKGFVAIARCGLTKLTEIGEGAIIQAGSVVHGEIPPCAIAGGNPAKVFAWRNKEHYAKLKSQGAYFATNS